MDLLLTRSFARAAKVAGARRFGLVSSVGADARSRYLYLRTKGEAEAAVSGSGFENVAVVRPSFLIGERAEPRPVEALAALAVAFLLCRDAGAACGPRLSPRLSWPPCAAASPGR